MDLSSITPRELRRAATLVETIEKLNRELSALDSSEPVAKPLKRKRKLSAAGRLAIAAAQKARWKKVKSSAKPTIKKRAKRKMSAAAKAKIAKAAKARWAKAKAAGKKTL